MIYIISKFNYIRRDSVLNEIGKKMPKYIKTAYDIVFDSLLLLFMEIALH